MKKDYVGAKKAEIQELPQIKERISFLYVERCLVNKNDSAVSITDERGTVNAPAASLSVIMLGPGTSITHRAMELLGNVGVTVIWTGERGVRYYASGSPLTHSSSLLTTQAALVTNVRSRLAVARKMYQMRFPDDDVSDLTMQQLRGKEGARVRRVYRNSAKQYNVEWTGREYDPDDFEGGSAVNQALSAGTACLYGLAHSVIVALGCSPGLGFVHTGHERSFVYDIADLYKAEFVIPTAFKIASENLEDISGEMRRSVRNLISEKHLLERIVKDLHYLLTDSEDIDVTFSDIVDLWDEKSGTVKNGISYGKDISPDGEELALSVEVSE
ncbi:MAG: type I-E CRISPR-associated endonuclease Cas1e [Selenomonadaceae bacterium]|nr:type I-E CRISPR-associated endonuclease Cas1e [Selenomonadaceae bacterium]